MRDHYLCYPAILTDTLVPQPGLSSILQNQLGVALDALTVPKVGEGVTAADVKRFIQLDSTAKNIICGHLTKGQYDRVSALETVKLV